MMKAETRFIAFPSSPASGWGVSQAKDVGFKSSATVLSVLREKESTTDKADTECLDRLVCEDRAAFRQLFDRYYKELYCYARKYVQSVDVCKDILQDVFSYLWEKREQLEVTQSVKAYLYRAVHHRCINHLKKTDNDYRHLNNYHLQQQIVQPHQQDSLHLLQEKEMQETINRVVNELPEQCRKIFILSRENGLRHKEIAQQLCISPKTVEVQIYRALKYLKQQLSFAGKQQNEKEKSNHGY